MRWRAAAVAILIATGVLLRLVFAQEGAGGGTLSTLGIDIRARGALTASATSATYTVAIEDCSGLAEIVVPLGTETRVVAPSDARAGTVPLSCEVDFARADAGRFNPSVELRGSDGTIRRHSEQFAPEAVSPQIGIERVGLASGSGDQAGQQFLEITVSATDDVDLAYVTISAVGVRASVLRATGGVVEEAGRSAFARTQGALRVYPRADGQRAFSLLVPVAGALSAEEVAHDGVVLVDAAAVDASGNETATAKIAFTGDDVVEQASDLSVRPDRVVFTSILETETLVPSVRFQFRGLTPLPGAGSGVQYQSSHPNLVAVSPGGVVYPLALPTTEEVRITVTYPGLAPVDVPVIVDPSRTLVGLRAEGLDESGRFVLERLNAWRAMPTFRALFDDGSETAVNSRFSFSYRLDGSAAGILEHSAAKGLLARAAIPDDAPQPLTVSLTVQPEIATVVPVVARDAMPQITLEVANEVVAGETLRVRAVTEDDVGVKSVRFFADDAEIGVREAAPQEV